MQWMYIIHNSRLPSASANLTDAKCSVIIFASPRLETSLLFMTFVISLPCRELKIVNGIALVSVYIFPI